GGMAWMRDADLARRVGELADTEPWPSAQRVLKFLRIGKLQVVFSRPGVFTFSGFPILLAASWLHARPDVYLWEQIRRLDPLPASYRGRYSNVQAALGLAGLARLPEWIERTRGHARTLNSLLGDIPGVIVPRIPADREHVYYQYCAYVPDR